jgi:hypothetical protein
MMFLAQKTNEIEREGKKQHEPRKNQREKKNTG